MIVRKNLFTFGCHVLKTKIFIYSGIFFIICNLSMTMNTLGFFFSFFNQNRCKFISQTKQRTLRLFNLMPVFCTAWNTFPGSLGRSMCRV